MPQKENVILTTIVALLSIIGTCFAISSQFVSKSEFQTFGTERATRFTAVESRLSRMEDKLDDIRDVVYSLKKK